MKARANVPGLTAFVLLLSGCASAPVAPDSDTPADDLGPERRIVTCLSLLDDSTTAAFAAAAADGWSYSEDFEQRLVDQGHPLAKFVEWGGVACQWGYPNTDHNVYEYAWSPITDVDARKIELDLAERGHAQTDEFGGRLHCIRPSESALGYDDCYLLHGDEWLYSANRSELPMLVAQAGQH